MTVDLYILAAGRSVRMGRPKPLVEIGGISLLERSIRAGRASPARGVTVVTGSAHVEVEALAASLGAGTIRNEQYREGVASSVAAAARHAGVQAEPADGLLLAGCDQPFLTAGLLGCMISASREGRSRIVACEYMETVGIPALFPSDLWSELLDLEGDRGAKSILERHSGRLLRIGWEDGRINVNTMDDLGRIDPASLPDPGDPIMIV
jgi:molybdenum cofactor cytidylyltransferase